MVTTKYKIPESVLVVIHTADMDVLLLERADRPGFWQSVTGAKDTEQETLFETAAREVAEETGILVRLRDDGEPPVAGEVPAANLRDWEISNTYEIYPVWRHRYAPGVITNTERVFGLLVPRDIGVLLAPAEHLQYAWLPYREAADRCFSSSNAEAILQLPTRMSKG
jgi:dATP pyrophosphohydrolase